MSKLNDSKKKVLVTCELAAESFALLKSQSQLDIAFSAGPQPTEQELENCEALLIRSGTKLHARLLEKAPKLQFVVTATSGFDHIDLNYCQQNSIEVSYCPCANRESAAQLTLAMILNSLRQLPDMHRQVQKNQWRQNLKRGFELTSLQLGIVGLGRIGKRVAQLAKAFQMEVVAHDPYLDSEIFQQLHVTPLGLIELFKTSDVVTFHVPLTSETKHLVNHRTLAHFNPEAYLINASRGAVFDETELAVRMREGLFRGAALDVFEKEPLAKESPLRELNNVVFSPHIGAFTEQAFERASREAAEKVCQFFQRKTIEDRLPPATDWAPFLISQ